jgi:hypothetical protein
MYLHAVFVFPKGDKRHHPVSTTSLRPCKLTKDEVGVNLGKARRPAITLGVSALEFTQWQAILTKTGHCLDQALISDSYLDGRR